MIILDEPRQSEMYWEKGATAIVASVRPIWFVQYGHDGSQERVQASLKRFQGTIVLKLTS